MGVEEIAANLLDVDMLKTFIDFYDFLNINQFAKAKTGVNNWSIKYKNKRIGSIRLRENLWFIRYFDLFPRVDWFERCEKYLTSELREFILTNINTSSSCCVKGVCHSVENKVILGKLFNGRVCACGPIMLMNPDGKTLEYAKELALIGKSIIAEIQTNIAK